MNSSTALSAGIVSVPVLVNISDKVGKTEAEKKKESDKKRVIMRQREAAYRSFLAQTTSSYEENLRIWNRQGAVNYRCLAVAAGNGSAYVPPNSVAATVDVVVRNHATAGLHVPFLPSTFRRKVSSGETPEQFQVRLTDTAKHYWALGVSYVDGACNCKNCCSERAQYYRYVSAPENQPKKAAGNRLSDWDQEHNPYAKNYLYRENRNGRYGGNRSDEAGNRLARGVAMRNRLHSTIPGRPSGATVGAGSRSGPKVDHMAKGGAARLVGLEVEHNNRTEQTHQWVSRWPGAQLISDGSCGYEAVTPPISGKYVRECITDLTKTLNDSRAGCDSRCGLHVHVDARDMRWADMMRFLSLYCRLESLLFLIGGQNRYTGNGSHYCRPVSKLYSQALQSTDPKGAVLAAAVLSDDALRAAKEGREAMARAPVQKKGNGRYKAINIMPWIAGRAYNRADTTVEFRLHRGSHNGERLIMWASICQDIVQFACTATNADVDALPKSAARALCVISPRCKEWIIRRILGWRKATTATRNPVEDDVGNVRPRRIVSLKEGLYLVDKSRVAGIRNGEE